MLFNSIFGRKNSVSSTSSKGIKLNKKNHQPRQMFFEPLESRDLLTVTTGLIDNAAYNEIRAAYPEFNLPELQSDLNVMTITPDDGELSLDDLKSAIATAGTTTKPDLILVQTSASANSVTYASKSDEVTINVDSTQYGSVTIIGWGEESFTLDANQKSRVMTIEGSSTVVNLGGLTITNGVSGNSSSNSSYGGGIDNNGTLTVTNSTISGNTASGSSYSYGGGIYNSSGTMTITNSTISGNTASSYGGGIYNNYSYNGTATLTITNSTISGNTASRYDGGGIYNSSGTMTITNSIVSRNHGGNVYGSLSSNSSNNLIGGYYPGFINPPQFDSEGKLTNADTMDLLLRSDSIAIDKGDNAAVVNIESDIDGAARIFGETVDIGAYEYQGNRNDEPIPYSTVVNTLNDSFDLNDDEWSLREAIYYAPEYVTITFADELSGTIVLSLGQLEIEAPLAIDGNNRIVIDGNQKSRIFYVSAGTEDAPVVLDGLTIQNGQATRGGGIYNTGTTTITNSTISGNTAYSGGGIDNYGYNGTATLTITNSTIAGNTASNFGGGICNYGDHGTATVTVTNSTISRNSASDTGGGIYNNGRNGTATLTTLTITNSTISGNTAYDGGGIDNYSGTLTITNSTIAGNTASGSSYSYGGGIYNDSGTLTVTNSTIAGNTASNNGGGIYNY